MALKQKIQELFLNNDGIELISLSGKPIQAKVPENSTTNIVSEQITVSNLPNEELVAVVMNGGAKKISSEFEVRDENFEFEDTEYEIKIDTNIENSNFIYWRSLSIFLAKAGLPEPVNIGSAILVGIGFVFSVKPKIGKIIKKWTK